MASFLLAFRFLLIILIFYSLPLLLRVALTFPHGLIRVFLLGLSIFHTLVVGLLLLLLLVLVTLRLDLLLNMKVAMKGAEQVLGVSEGPSLFLFYFYVFFPYFTFIFFIFSFYHCVFFSPFSLYFFIYYYKLPLI